LARLADHAVADGLRLSLLAAPLLAGLSEDIGQFDGDAGWQQLLAQRDSLRAFQPEVPATLQASLRPYQLQGFAWLSRLAHIGAGACLADDMGLGKTVQTWRCCSVARIWARNWWWHLPRWRSTGWPRPPALPPACVCALINSSATYPQSGRKTW
jgi:hypothetical protein